MRKMGFGSEGNKAMRKLENSVIPCSAEIDLNGIPTVGNLTEINRTYIIRKLRRNLMEILTEMLNGTEIHQNFRNFRTSIFAEIMEF